MVGGLLGCEELLGADQIDSGRQDWRGQKEDQTLNCQPRQDFCAMGGTEHELTNIEELVRLGYIFTGALNLFLVFPIMRYLHGSDFLAKNQPDYFKGSAKYALSLFQRIHFAVCLAISCLTQTLGPPMAPT
jgi:hypothetical protein